MHGASGIECDFCDIDGFRSADVFIENELCYFTLEWLRGTEALQGPGLVLPRAHRETPFDLTDEEWFATRVLLIEAKAVIDDRLRPDGYNLAWNVGTDAGQEAAHVHLHLIPRFADEPHAGKGARWMLKQPENHRPDPTAQGFGRAVH